MTGQLFDELIALQSTLNAEVGGGKQDQALREGQREAFAECMRIACNSNTADMRRKVKRLLRKHGYPPDLQAEATKTVLEQAEALCADWAA